MYTVPVGQRLLRVWLERTGEQLTARQFFDERLYLLFFEPAKMLQWVPNSPFVQQVSAAERQRQPERSVREIQLGRLHQLAAAMATGGVADASFVVGYPAAGVAATTSGQVSDNTPTPDPEQVYCSWLGAALGIGTAGAVTLLLAESSILWALVEGWTHYRALLDEHPNLKGHQIETWNGRWLVHVLSAAYDPTHPLLGFDFAQLLETRGGAPAIVPQHWVPLLVALAQHLPAPHVMAYVYALNKTNRTIGFIPLYLAEIRTLPAAYHHLFGLAGTGVGWAALSQAYETRLGLAAACESGSVGLVALEPARLRQYLPVPVSPARTPAQARQQEIYQLWLHAMLRNDQNDQKTPSSAPVSLPEAADRLAEALLVFARHETALQRGRGKTENPQLVERVLAAPFLSRFVTQLTEVLAAAPDAAGFRPALEAAVGLVASMPPRQFPLFVALLRFRYVARANQPNEL
jgi:hypothetical protein